LQAEVNHRITQVDAQTPAGQLLRRFWQPVALLDEFDATLAPRMANRPLKAVKLMGQDLVLFRDASGQWSLVDRACPHRGADLAYARYEGDGIRCPFHGWKFDANGQCLETPAEPEGSRMCERIRQETYPVQEASGVLFAWLGPRGAAPPLPPLDCFAAPSTHTFAFKGMWQCNWLQAFEVGIDPAHTSFLHRFFEDEALDSAYGKQFRGASAGQVNGEDWPMTRIMRECPRPDIAFEERPYGFEITTVRHLSAQAEHVRVTHAIAPHTFVIPLSRTMTITQMHVPVDEHNTYWYAIFTSFDEPVDKDVMRAQRLQGVSLPNYLPIKGAHNDWGFDPQEQATRTFLGMGEDDINVHDQWACESMGRVQDRTKEHLASTDRVIAANRRWLRTAIDTVEQGGLPPSIAQPEVATQTWGPDTVDGIAPAASWQRWWRDESQSKRQAAPWKNPACPQEGTL
jgi:phthalate 4,5-dioxygenase